MISGKITKLEPKEGKYGTYYIVKIDDKQGLYNGSIENLKVGTPVEADAEITIVPKDGKEYRNYKFKSIQAVYQQREEHAAESPPVEVYDRPKYNGKNDASIAAQNLGSRAVELTELYFRRLDISCVTLVAIRETYEHFICVVTDEYIKCVERLSKPQPQASHPDPQTVGSSPPPADVPGAVPSSRKDIEVKIRAMCAKNKKAKDWVKDYCEGKHLEDLVEEELQVIHDSVLNIISENVPF